jgi:hypothetical protein
LYEKDTINLKINNFKNGEVTGNHRKYANKISQIVGEFLVIHYLLTLFKVLMKRHLKPNGFLKNGNELILGNGKNRISLGASLQKASLLILKV